MRFKKGSKIEVLSKPGMPSGSWRTAEIICGNGHNYTVRYEGYMGAAGEDVVERVSIKAVRPCPPLLEVLESFVPGDIVEVFVDFSWKMATVVKVLGNKYCLVRLLGSSCGFEVCIFDIRVRQSWQDGTWIVIGKASQNFADEEHTEKPALKYNLNSRSQIQQSNTRARRCLEDEYAVRDNIKFQESHFVSSKTLKRGLPYYNSQVGPYAGTTKKLRMMDKEGRLRQEIVSRPSPLLEKVDPIASPQNMQGEYNIHTAFNSRTTGCTEMVSERSKVNGTVGCSLAVSLEPNHAVSFTSSVGSCSSSPYKFPHHFYKAHVEDIEGNFSDAESFCQREYDEGNYLLPTTKELAAEIHSLELHAYRCTMEALHAMGPLSWEQETLVTNLRLSLNISNDEHLMEIRSLISGDTIIPGQSWRLVHHASKYLLLLLGFATFLMGQQWHQISYNLYSLMIWLLHCPCLGYLRDLNICLAKGCKTRILRQPQDVLICTSLWLSGSEVLT